MRTKEGPLCKPRGLVTVLAQYTEAIVISPCHHVLPTCMDVHLLGEAPGSGDDMVVPYPSGPVLVLPKKTAQPGRKSDHFIPRMIFLNACTKPSVNSTCPAYQEDAGKSL